MRIFHGHRLYPVLTIQHSSETQCGMAYAVIKMHWITGCDAHKPKRVEVFPMDVNVCPTQDNDLFNVIISEL